MKNPVHESMTPLRIQFGPKEQYLKIRVWRDETEPFSLGKNKDLFEKIDVLGKSKPKFETIQGLVKSVAQNIGAMDRVSAVEVLVGETGVGIVFYPDWK